MRRDTCGVWTAGGSGCGAVPRTFLLGARLSAEHPARETNEVADPYSLALTADSTRSLLVPLFDRP
jgi:hypothetical protein